MKELTIQHIPPADKQAARVCVSYRKDPTAQPQDTNGLANDFTVQRVDTRRHPRCPPVTEGCTTLVILPLRVKV